MSYNINTILRLDLTDVALLYHAEVADPRR